MEVPVSMRLSPFEYFCYTRQHDELKTLADYCIDQYFPDIACLSKSDEDRYSLFFEAVVKKTADLIARWQAAGFAHGVMNTDNMSIIGDTFDYGPYGFQDDFDWNYICNHSDHTGRYAFSQQPDIGYWNCGRLAQVLVPLLSKPDSIQVALDLYPDTYTRKYLELMSKKLGLVSNEPDDRALVSELLQVLHDQRMDYTIFFRTLSHYSPQKPAAKLFDLCKKPEQLRSWLNSYDKRLSAQTINDDSRHKKMRLVNPKFILRNYLAQNAIETAERGDYSEIKRLMTVLTTPFDEHTTLEHYSSPPPEWGKQIEISCSS